MVSGEDGVNADVVVAFSFNWPGGSFLGFEADRLARGIDDWCLLDVMLTSEQLGKTAEKDLTAELLVMAEAELEGLGAAPISARLA